MPLEIGYRRWAGDGLGLGTSPQLGKVGQTCTVQQGALSDINVARKQTLSPGLTLPMVAVTVVDWPGCNGVARLESPGPILKPLPPAGVRSTCETGSVELFATLNVQL